MENEDCCATCNTTFRSMQFIWGVANIQKGGHDFVHTRNTVKGN